MKYVFTVSVVHISIWTNTIIDILKSRFITLLACPYIFKMEFILMINLDIFTAELSLGKVIIL